MKDTTAQSINQVICIISFISRLKVVPSLNFSLIFLYTQDVLIVAAVIEKQTEKMTIDCQVKLIIELFHDIFRLINARSVEPFYVNQSRTINYFFCSL
jgi:hypothetical protein